MASEEEKKKFLTDQMKGMLGPCMITFAIPLTIPGLTLTLVVFSGDKTFPKYGALHVIGILFLGFSVILLILGCIFRFMWKPRMDPEVLKHLTPANSLRLKKKDAESAKRVRTLNGIYKGDSPRPNKSDDNATNISVNCNQKDPELPQQEIPKNENISLTMNRLPEAEYISEHTEHTQSKMTYESDESDACSGDSLRGKKKVNENSVKSPRHSRHLVPLIKSNEHAEKQQRPDSPRRKSPSYDEIQKWRHKKKKKSELRSETGFGVDNHGSECDEESGEVLTSNTLKRTDSFEAEDFKRSRQYPVNTDANSVVNSDQTEKRKKKKKKKKNLKAKRDIAEENTNEKETERQQSFTNKSEKTDSNIQAHMITGDSTQLFKNEVESEDSDASVGSADSVLAQYTSRTQKDQ